MATRYMRWGWAIASLAAAISLTSVTMVSASPTEGPAIYGYASGYHSFAVIHVADVSPLALFDGVVLEKRVTRERVPFKPVAMKPRASRQAVLPSSVAGWRSGRVKSLSS